MGDRSLTVFVDKFEAPTDISPVVYMHWSGGRTRRYLEAAAGRMRAGDTSYSAARFCGYCHGMIEGNLALGIFGAPDRETDDTLGTWAVREHHGDAGMFIVDVSTGIVRQFLHNADKPASEFTLAMGNEQHRGVA